MWAMRMQPVAHEAPTSIESAFLETEEAHRIVAEVSHGALSLDSSSLGGELPITSAKVADALLQNAGSAPGQHLAVASRILVKAAEMETSPGVSVASAASSQSDDGRKLLLQFIANSCASSYPLTRSAANGRRAEMK
jgi:hypothetical protein